MSREIENLLRLANSADETTTSVNSARRTFAGEDESRQFFGDACRRLLDITEWSASSSGSAYELFDANGAASSGRPIRESDFIRINIYGSGKYDWVQVMRIHRSDDEMVITVKPSHDPTAAPPDPRRISHFFHGDARNNFCVQLERIVVSMYVIGLNERQNVSETRGVVETVRNAATANLGYYLGIQKTIWIEFCKNLLRSADGEAGER